MTSLDTIMTRIVTLAGQVSGVTTSVDTLPKHIDAATLPLMFVTEGLATYDYPDSEMTAVSREFLLLLWVQAFDNQDATVEQAAREACRPFLTSVPKYFRARRQLNNNDAGVTGVVSARITRDDGPATASRDGVLYYGVAFRLTVIYNED